jgi:hypothetical protein
MNAIQARELVINHRRIEFEADILRLRQLIDEKITALARTGHTSISNPLKGIKIFVDDILMKKLQASFLRDGFAISNPDEFKISW